MNDIEREIFGRATPDRAALASFGFEETDDGTLSFRGDVVDGDFYVVVSVSPRGEISSRVIDAQSDDEYLPIFAEAHTGEFVGRVRKEYADFLQKIADSCFVRTPFHTAQANRLTAHIESAFGEREDRPFADSPDIGVFRSPRTKKWYGIVMQVKKGVLAGEKDAPDADSPVEVVNLKVPPDDVDALVLENGIYPAYHMNRKNWISILLNDTVDDDELFRLIAQSRAFADPLAIAGPTRYIVPSDPKIDDVDAHFEREGIIIWRQPKSAKVGDVVYLYYGAPISAVRWRCEIDALGLIDEVWGDPMPQMLLCPTVRYPDDFCTFRKLGELGIKAVRGARRATAELARYLDSYVEEDDRR